ncbi:Cilia- and flagella-associated protein 100, partial [Quaeritorhiza haematococci]
MATVAAPTTTTGAGAPSAPVPAMAASNIIGRKKKPSKKPNYRTTVSLRSRMLKLPEIPKSPVSNNLTTNPSSGGAANGNITSGPAAAADSHSASDKKDGGSGNAAAGGVAAGGKNAEGLIQENPNPFHMPSDVGVFAMRELERKQKQEAKSRMKHLSIFEKSSLSSSSQHQRKNFRALLAEDPDDIEFYEELRRRDSDKILINRGGAVPGVGGAGADRHLGKENLHDFISKKREMFLVQYALGVKREEMQKLEEIAQAEEQKLLDDEKALEEDAAKFDAFLKENDKNSVEAIKRAEIETKAKLEKIQEIKKLNVQIMTIRSDMSKNEDQLRDLQRYRQFLCNLSPMMQQHQGQNANPGQGKDEAGASGAANGGEAGAATVDAGARGKGRRGGKNTKGKTKSNGDENSLTSAQGQRSATKKTERRATKSKSSADPTSKVSKDIPDTSSDPSNPAANAAPAPAHTDDTSDDDWDDDESSSDQAGDQQEDVFGVGGDGTAGDDPLAYFKTPQQLLDIFAELEENNLALIQNCQETEETLEELRQKIGETEARMEGETASLKQQIDFLNAAVAKEVEKAQVLEERAKIFSGIAGTELQERLLEELNHKVKEVYRRCIGDNEANLSTLQMLTNIENRLEQLFETIEMMPQDKVEQAEKVKDKERRQRLREEKMETQRILQEERVQRALERARAPVKKKTGKPVVFRSAIPQKKKKKEEDTKKKEE